MKYHVLKLDALSIHLQKLFQFSMKTGATTIFWMNPNFILRNKHQINWFHPCVHGMFSVVGALDFYFSSKYYSTSQPLYKNKFWLFCCHWYCSVIVPFYNDYILQTYSNLLEVFFILFVGGSGVFSSWFSWLVPVLVTSFLESSFNNGGWLHKHILYS